MIDFTNELMSDLTLNLNTGETAYIKVSGICANIFWSLKIIDSGATCDINIGLESDSFFALPSTVHSDLLLKGIMVGSTPTTGFIANVLGESQIAPTYIYIKNTSGIANKHIRFNLRGNR
jgi:hypothetical protein